MTTTPLHGGAGLGTPRRPGCGPRTGTLLQALLPSPAPQPLHPRAEKAGQVPGRPRPPQAVVPGLGTRVTAAITAHGCLGAERPGTGDSLLV